MSDLCKTNHNSYAYCALKTVTFFDFLKEFLSTSSYF